MSRYDDVTTTNLADFGWRELKMAAELLNAMIEQGLPDDFEFDGVTVMMNRNSGNVFLTNSEYQVAMMNEDKLQSWYTCPNCGREGFAEDIEWNHDQGLCGECAEPDETDEESEDSEDEA